MALTSAWALTVVVERSGAPPKIKVILQSEVPNFPAFLALFWHFPDLFSEGGNHKNDRTINKAQIWPTGLMAYRVLPGRGFELHCEHI